jgi:hypothetical protein
MLVVHGGRMLLGNADEQKPAADGTVEGWGRLAQNPVGRWYGIKKGLRGRFGSCVPPCARGSRSGRGRARRPEQPDAGNLTARRAPAHEPAGAESPDDEARRAGTPD